MLPVRVAIVLVFLGGLVLFTVQNLSPALPLVILGGSTQALPLSVWIGGAIAAGAATTLTISTLLTVARPVRRSVPKSPPKRPAAGRSTGFRTPWSSPPGTAGATGATAGATRATAGATRFQDDWEASPPKDEWDDWDEPAARTTDRQGDRQGDRASQSRPPEPEIRDRSDEDWANWDGYEDYSGDFRRSNPVYEPTEPPPSSRPDPRRTDFEAPQEPVTRMQSGSVYSYSYNRSKEIDRPSEDNQGYETGSDSGSDRPDSPPGKTSEVYDAEYRVLTPPYRSNPEPIPEDDWGFEEGELDSLEPDEPTERHDRRPRL